MFASTVTPLVLLLIVASAILPADVRAETYSLKSGERLLETICSKEVTDSPQTCVRDFLYANKEWFEIWYGYKWEEPQEVSLQAARKLWAHYPYTLPNGSPANVFTAHKNPQAVTTEGKTHSGTVEVDHKPKPKKQTTAPAPETTQASVTAGTVNLAGQPEPGTESPAIVEDTLPPKTPTETPRESVTNGMRIIPPAYGKNSTGPNQTTADAPNVHPHPKGAYVGDAAHEDAVPEQGSSNVSPLSASQSKRQIAEVKSRLLGYLAWTTLAAVVEFILLIGAIVLLIRNRKVQKLLHRDNVKLYAQLCDATSLLENRMPHFVSPNGEHPFT